MAAVALPRAEAVTARLEAAERERRAQVAQRREDRLEAAAPSESVEGFVSRFNAQCTQMTTALNALSTSGGEEGGTKQAEKVLLGLVEECAALEATVAAAAYFLPSYEKRASLSAVAALLNRIQTLRETLAPRQPFKFASRHLLATQAESAAAAAAATPAAMAGAEPKHDHLEDGPGLRRVTGPQVVVVPAAELDGGEYVLSDLRNVTVWLCGPLRALFVHRLVNCKVYVGAVGGSVLLEGIHDCQLHLAAKQIRIHDAHNTHFYLRARSNPIVEHCTEVGVAPYNMSYNGILTHHIQAQLDEENDLWEQVNDFGWLRATPSPNWHVLDEDARCAHASMEIPGQQEDDACVLASKAAKAAAQASNSIGPSQPAVAEAGQTMPEPSAAVPSTTATIAEDEESEDEI